MCVADESGECSTSTKKSASGLKVGGETPVRFAPASGVDDLPILRLSLAPGRRCAGCGGQRGWKEAGRRIGSFL